MNKLELMWVGKYDKENQVRPEPRILIENPEYSYTAAPKTEEQMSFDTSEQNSPKCYSNNMLIHGDNLLALKSLEQDYAGKIKCIYIDPPYNTGSAFEHYDDNLEHSTWLSLMKPRLELLRNLLAEDGVAFIQIDSNEYPYLKILLHEVFGRYNEIGDFIWQKKKGGGNDSRYLAIEHEYIIAMAKNKNNLPHWHIEYDNDYASRYNEEDDKGRFYWDTFKRASGKQYYPITCPDGTVIEYDENGHKISWLRSEARFKNDLLIGEARIIRINNKWSVQFKQYMGKGKKPRSLLTDIATNSDAKNEMLSLFSDPKAFDYPKPEALIKHLLSIATQPGDLVLDSFLGSGTTAAVAHKMGRRWIGIELGEHAYTHCYPRMKAVCDGEQGGISKAVKWQGGGGFKFYELAPSLLQKDKFGNYVISDAYNAEMLAAAMARQEGYIYAPDEYSVWKQGYSGEKNYIFTTTAAVTPEYLDYIASELGGDEYLLICAESYSNGCENRYPNITIKPIPQTILKRCEYGRDNYDLNVAEQKIDSWEDEEDV